ncbi:unnamed protein product [Cylicocyclus nassatus]|uniref:Centrosomal protein CEP104 Zn finger domain-containing protein n=1 Tax=Cylicocyclus nassatus TaxID=53992 RepID=A0AA36GXK9_CYLNA|nr:unnamed protein product [Cylicocyclus nassatus]
MSSYGDKAYEEYLMRREREQRSNIATPYKKSTRSKPNSQQPQNATLSEEKRVQLKGDGSYDIPNNVYHSSGYASRQSELGEDPVSTVRTLRTQLRRMAVRCQEEDAPVKAHLCEKACDRLTGVEAELMSLGRQKTSAILSGDTKKADLLSIKMEKLKEDAVRDTYSDLVMDKEEMKAFGVNSEWTPVKRPEQQKPSTPVPPPPKQKKPKPAPITIKTQTEALEAPPIVEKIEEMPESPSPRDVKRNARLSAILAAAKPDQVEQSAQPYDNPYSLPDKTGTCQFCGVTAPDLGIPSRLEYHYKTSCLLMTRCRFCSKVVLTPQLDDHIINRCPFVLGNMVPCSACGMATDATDDANGVGHPMCRGRLPPSGARWCPLCAVAVDDNKEAWKTHLSKQCYNNPRRSGPDLELDIAPQIPEKKTRPNSSKSTKAVSGARLIDADKLVAALQEVQLRKKQESKKKAPVPEKEETGTASTK